MTIFEIGRPGTHERTNRRLAGWVNAKGSSALYTRNGTRKNDGAAIVQEGQSFLNREECALYVDIEQLVEMFFGDVAEGNEFADAGVGEDNIDSSLHFSDGLVEKIKIGHFGNVALNAGRIGTDCFHGLVELLLAAPGDEHISTFIDEQLCGCQPNPFCSASDDGDLAFELFRHCLILCCWARTRQLSNGCRAISECSKQYPHRTSYKAPARHRRCAVLQGCCPASGRDDLEAGAQYRIRRSQRQRFVCFSTR